MSWNNNFTSPNWAGNDNATSGGGSSGSDVGNLYIVPDPPTITENPNIGLEGRNEVPLPTKYKDLEVDNLTATTINGNPDFDASKWSLYRAISDVRGTLGAFSLPLYDIADFRNITAGNTITAQLGSVIAGLNVEAGVAVSAPVGGFNQVTAEDINVSFTDETADVNIYGANLLAGDNALYVEGGTTLTGGGIIHGVTIGALQVAGIDTIRIDVLPVGMTLTSATFIAITAAGAASLVAGGALALAGGDYIEYNTDDNRFINTTSGNDNTNILVGNIYPAFTGSASLRINGGGSGRGVELGDVKSINLWTELPIADWVNSTSYVAGNKVKYAGLYYTCVVANAYTQPNIPIPNWVSASNYITGTIVFSSPYVFRCTASISGSTTPPDPTSDPNWFNLGLLTNAITAIWSVYSPYVSTITGDELSVVNVGNVRTDTLKGKSSLYQVNVDASLVATSGTYQINNFNSILLQGKPSFDPTLTFESTSASTSNIKQINSTNELQINTAGGLKIDTTTSTDFSAGDVVNLKNLTLTTALNPIWSDATTYALNDMVERDGYNWRSEIAGNVGNIPQALLSPWLLSSNYVVGNVRYDVGANNSYLCIANVSGSTTPPSADPTNWSFFQVGSNAEDVWFQMNAVVQSTIVGDRLSSIQIGQQEFVGEAGTYLVIGQEAGQVGTLDATIATSGSLTLVGTDNATLGALTGTAAIAGDSVIIQTIPTTGGSIVIEANEDLTMGAIEDVALASTTGNVNITTLAGDIIVNSADELTLVGANNVALGSTLGDVNVEATAGAMTITSKENLDLTTTGTGNINVTTLGDLIVSTDLLVGITSQTTITLACDGDLALNSSSGNVVLSPATGGVVLMSKDIDMNDNNITDANTITARAGLTLASTGANNINLSPDTGGLIVANKGLNLSNNNVTNANTITGQGALTLATTGATNLNLSPDTGGLIIANKGLSMTGNTITNCSAFGNNGSISIASTTGSIFLSPSTSSGTGVVQLSKDLNMANNNITNANTITGQTALSLTAANGQLNLTATGAGNRINVNTDTQFNNRTLFNFTGTNVGGIFGLTTQSLNLVGQQATPAVTIRGSLTMWQNGATQGAGNSISGVTTLNGRNLFSYGNFYNTATQTLGAINTATRIQMDTSANNNLITLDTTTNIGRITFTNAGVYHVVWNAYLFHGSGGTTKSCVWIRLNGTDVAGSGKTENNDSQQNETNMTSSSMINATANQYIEFFWAADDTNVPLTAVAASAPYPLTPSFSCTINIVG